ncbi:acyl-CoA hydrolase [Deinococcus sp. HSC-46F16]|nr:hypothetical protein [Deinococcus sp. HSC-46F16]MCP2014922.1 acyl-CoA hydrolase [Deinococcus sp. HSC-46F16]
MVPEQGAAEILGHDEKAQAAALLKQAAHPHARPYLWEEARRLGLT